MNRRHFLRAGAAMPLARAIAAPLAAFGFAQLAAEKQEPLAAQFAAFLQSMATRERPRVDGPAAARALRVSHDILAKIEEHGAQVHARLEGYSA